MCPPLWGNAVNLSKSHGDLQERRPRRSFPAIHCGDKAYTILKLTTLPVAVSPQLADPLSQGGRRRRRRGVPAPGFLTRRGLIGQHGVGTPCADALSPLGKGDFTLERRFVHRRGGFLD